jgi:glutamate-1-semialdehyde 2,1-aminomutase
MNTDQVREQAEKLMPGGVSSPVRSFKAVGIKQVVVKNAKGAYIWTWDDIRLIDLINSWGALILGHARDEVVNAINRAAEDGTSYGLTSYPEIALAQIICSAIPGAEMVRFVSSGTEAVMSAIRLARAFTGREKIVKFDGCYHGHYDSVLVSAGSGVATLALPGTPGITEGSVSSTIVVPYNDVEMLENVFKAYGEQIACVIVEPIAANMGVVLPEEHFIKRLESIVKKFGALLIFDEVITGFRVKWGSVAEIFGVYPDLFCLGKVIGGGMPLAAYAGKREIMEKVAPSGDVYQAGTLSGNPVAASAGVAALSLLKELDPYDTLAKAAVTIKDAAYIAAQKRGVPVQFNSIGSMFTIFFTDQKVINYDTAKTSNLEIFSRFFSKCFNKGVLLPPSQFEASFLTVAHSPEIVSQVAEIIESAIESI